jgi:hypothetical protein
MSYCTFMLFTLTNGSSLSKDIGCFGPPTHPLNDNWGRYVLLSFETLPFGLKRSMIVRIGNLQRSGF